MAKIPPSSHMGLPHDQVVGLPFGNFGGDSYHLFIIVILGLVCWLHYGIPMYTKFNGFILDFNHFLDFSIYGEHLRSGDLFNLFQLRLAVSGRKGPPSFCQSIIPSEGSESNPFSKIYFSNTYIYIYKYIYIYT